MKSVSIRQNLLLHQIKLHLQIKKHKFHIMIQIQKIL